MMDSGELRGKRQGAPWKDLSWSDAMVAVVCLEVVTV